MKIRFSALLTVEASLKAVEQNGYALQYVKDQTEPVCLKAVEQDGYALRYVFNLRMFVDISVRLGIETDQG